MIGFVRRRDEPRAGGGANAARRDAAYPGGWGAHYCSGRNDVDDPKLAEVVVLLRDLTNDMLPHMLKEEQVLFPYVTQLFGTVKNPLRMMMEHDRVGELLVSLAPRDERLHAGGTANPCIETCGKSPVRDFHTNTGLETGRAD